MKKVILPSVAMLIVFALFFAVASYYQFADFATEPTSSPDFKQEVLGETETEEIAAPSIILEDGQDLYVVDIDESVVTWLASKVVGKQQSGTVGLAAGNIVLKGDNLAQADFVLDMLSISEENSNESLEEHLKSEDFFAVEKYPLSELIITDAKLQVDGNYKMTGTLVIKDVSKEISFLAAADKADDTITAQAQFSIDRTLWGIEYGSDKFFDNLANEAIKDEIKFTIKIVAIK